MKKLAVLLIICSMLVSLLPQSAIAAESTSTGADLTAYLQEISDLRGFDVSQEDIEWALFMSGKTINDFQTLEELKEFLGGVIMADSSNLNDIYSKYSLDQTSLSEVLKEFGDELTDYIFIKELDESLDFYIVEKEADFEIKLAEYLAEVSHIRGFAVTTDDINDLNDYYFSIDRFETVTSLSDYLGEVIKADLSNLDYFYTEYGLDNEALLQLLEDNDLDINDFIYLNQVEQVVWSSSSEDSNSDMDVSDYMDILNQLGITETELTNLENHFNSISDYLSSDEGQTRLGDIINRMMTLLQSIYDTVIVDENYEMDDAKISEFASLYEELFSVLNLKISFSVIKDGVETSYEIEQAMKVEPVEGADYKIALSNDKSELILDAVITPEFLKTYLGEIIDDVKDVTNTEIKKEVPQTTKEDEVPRTVKGGKLPKTASNHIPMTLFGVVITICGIFVFRKMRTGKGEILKR